VDLAEQVERLYDLQREVEPDRELLENPFEDFARRTGRETPGANDQIPIYITPRIYCYFKPMNGVDATTADVFGHTVVSATLAECAAWRLAHAIGGVFEAIVLPQLLRKFSEIDDRAPGAVARRQPGKTQSDQPFSAVRELCRAAAFFDALIGQQDRNKNNWLWDGASSRFLLIDHGFAFGRPGDETLNPRFTRWRWKQGEQKLDSEELSVLDDLLGSDDLLSLRRFFDEDRCDALEARAREMRHSGTLMPVGEL
jgi:hypothetical protein